MIPDIDTRHAARLMIRRFGDKAALQAATRAIELLAGRDVDGALEWQKIVMAIEHLQVRSPGADKALH